MTLAGFAMKPDVVTYSWLYDLITLLKYDQSGGRTRQWLLPRNQKLRKSRLRELRTGLPLRAEPQYPPARPQEGLNRQPHLPARPNRPNGYQIRSLMQVCPRKEFLYPSVLDFHARESQASHHFSQKRGLAHLRLDQHYPQLGRHQLQWNRGRPAARADINGHPILWRHAPGRHQRFDNEPVDCLVGGPIQVKRREVHPAVPSGQQAQIQRERRDRRRCDGHVPPPCPSPDAPSQLPLRLAHAHIVSRVRTPPPDGPHESGAARPRPSTRLKPGLGVPASGPAEPSQLRRPRV
jgi:hypothetical protein